MAPVEAIFPQTPRHDATELVLADNVVEFARDESGGVPCPEQVVLSIEEVLAASFVVGHAAGKGRLPGTSDVGVGAAGTEGMLTSTGTVLGGVSAVTVLGAAA